MPVIVAFHPFNDTHTTQGSRDRVEKDGDLGAGWNYCFLPQTAQARPANNTGVQDDACAATGNHGEQGEFLGKGTQK